MCTLQWATKGRTTTVHDRNEAEYNIQVRRSRSWPGTLHKSALPCISLHSASEKESLKTLKTCTSLHGACVQKKAPGPRIPRKLSKTLDGYVQHEMLEGHRRENKKAYTFVIASPPLR